MYSEKIIKQTFYSIIRKNTIFSFERKILEKEEPSSENDI